MEVSLCFCHSPTTTAQIICTLGAVYISTEDAFPSKRLYQMANVFSEHHPCNVLTTKQLTDNIFIEHTGTVVCTVINYFITILVFPPSQPLVCYWSISFLHY